MPPFSHTPQKESAVFTHCGSFKQTAFIQYARWPNSTSAPKPKYGVNSRPVMVCVK